MVDKRMNKKLTISCQFPFIKFLHVSPWDGKGGGRLAQPRVKQLHSCVLFTVHQPLEDQLVASHSLLSRPTGCRIERNVNHPLVPYTGVT